MDIYISSWLFQSSLFYIINYYCENLDSFRNIHQAFENESKLGSIRVYEDWILKFVIENLTTCVEWPYINYFNPFCTVMCGGGGGGDDVLFNEWTIPLRWIILLLLHINFTHVLLCYTCIVCSIVQFLGLQPRLKFLTSGRTMSMSFTQVNL